MGYTADIKSVLNTTYGFLKQDLSTLSEENENHILYCSMN